MFVNAKKKPDEITKRPQCLTVRRTAMILSCSDRHVRNLIKRGRIKATRIGIGCSGLRVIEESLNRFMDDQKTRDNEI